MSYIKIKNLRYKASLNYLEIKYLSIIHQIQLSGMPRVKPHFLGGVIEILEISKNNEFSIIQKSCPLHELSLILLWEWNIGLKQLKSNPNMFDDKNLAFPAATNNDDISKFTVWQHFLTASIRKWSISNILRKINSPSNFEHQSSMHPWQDLTSFRSNS